MRTIPQVFTVGQPTKPCLIDDVVLLVYHTGDGIKLLLYHAGDKIAPCHTGDNTTPPYHTGDNVTHRIDTGDSATPPYHTGDVR